jgi:PhnB protein
MCAVRAIPEGYHSITPAITCKGAAKAIDFYKEAFQAKVISRMDGPGGTVAHADLMIGDSHFMLGDEFPGMSGSPAPNAPPCSSLFVYTDNVDQAFDRAVKAGCSVNMPLADQFWGDRYGKLVDPFGHHWGLAQHIEDVAPDEIKRRSEAWMAQMAKSAGQA